MTEQFDLLIKNSKIVDGTGAAAFTGSIGIKDEKIIAVGNVDGQALREIDGQGLVVCPGFIDIHAHGDVNLFQFPLAENFIMQGITTTVGGNCGMSMAPMRDLVPWGIFASSIIGGIWPEIEPDTYGPPNFPSLKKYGKILEDLLGYAFDWSTLGEFLSKLENGGVSLNYVPLVGHNTVRLAVMGDNFKRKAIPSEVDEMKRHVADAMECGAFGLGAGFDGGPGDFAPLEEAIELAKVARQYDGIYASHTRNFDNNFPSNNPDDWGYGICHHISAEEMSLARYFGYLESIEVARQAGISTQIAHLCPGYTIYQHYPENLQEAAAKATLDLIDHARAEGLDVSFDIIPDDDPHGTMLSQPGLIGLFSSWLTKLGSAERLVANLKIREFRNELKKEIMGGKFKFIMIHPKTDRFWMDRIVILICKNQNYVGKTIRQISTAKKTDPAEAVFDIIIEDPDTKFSCNDPRWTETTVKVLIQHPVAMIGSDLNVVPFGETKLQGGGGLGVGEPGLATYATYPRYIRRYVREKSILSLEEAVKKATYLPAQKLGIRDRGVIKKGTFADVLLFDFQNISDKGTWLKPRVRPEGINYVIINGKIVYENMTHTGVKSGRVLRRQ